MNDPTLERFMTASPHTIGSKQPLSAAHALMNEHAIRHLPVLQGGALAGILSQRDLHLIETLRDVDPDEVEVGEAMSTDVYTVAPSTPMRQVAREMADHKYGCAVVMVGKKVVGVFTTVDGLRALFTLLEE